VCPLHVSLDRSADGLLTVRDLGSTNGLVQLSAKTPLAVTEAVVNGDARFRIGKTVFRVRQGDQTIPPAVPLKRGRAAGLIRPTPWLNTVAIVGSVGLLTAHNYVGWFEELNAGTLLVWVAGFLMSILAWTGLWALATWLVSRRFEVVRHGAIPALALLASSLILEALEYVAFATNARLSYEISWWGATIVFITGLLYANLRVCFPPAPRRRLAAGAAAVSGITVGLFWMVSIGTRWQEAHWSHNLEYVAQLKRPMFRLAAIRSIDAFFEGTESMKEVVDRLARERSHRQTDPAIIDGERP